MSLDKRIETKTQPMLNEGANNMSHITLPRAVVEQALEAQVEMLAAERATNRPPETVMQAEEKLDRIRKAAAKAEAAITALRAALEASKEVEPDSELEAIIGEAKRIAPVLRKKGHYLAANIMELLVTHTHPAPAVPDYSRDVEELEYRLRRQAEVHAAEKEALHLQIKHITDPIVRQKMLEPSPPIFINAPAGWLRAVDEALVTAHLGVADAGDSYEDAKKKLDALIDWSIQVALIRL